jgi:hypothetical protein
MATQWIVDEEGNIVVRPLVDWTTVPAFEMSGLMQLWYVTSDEHLAAVQNGAAQPEALQIAIGVNACRELGKSLLDLADQLERSRPSGDHHKHAGCG